jgi:hypothetical protein
LVFGRAARMPEAYGAGWMDRSPTTEVSDVLCKQWGT